MASSAWRPAQETPHRLLTGAPRRGKWTPEEETYAAAIIQYFLSGVLPIQYGTTLRGYIAQLLHCDPMRVSKKLIPGSILVGVPIDPKIGRRAYSPCPDDMPGLADHRDVAMHHLTGLREAFIESIEREEEQEQMAQARLRYHPLAWHSSNNRHTTQEVPSVVYLRPLANEVAEPTVDGEGETESLSRPTSLPSLSELLRQNRLRVPSKTVAPPPPMTYQRLHPTHASVFHYASPPRHNRRPDVQTPSPHGHYRATTPPP